LGAPAVSFAIAPITDVFITADECVGALSIFFAIAPFTDIFISVGKRERALSVSLVVSEFTNVPTSIRVAISACAISPDKISVGWARRQMTLSSGKAWCYAKSNQRRQNYCHDVRT
jgi:hypothetical protein